MRTGPLKVGLKNGSPNILHLNQSIFQHEKLYKIKINYIAEIEMKTYGQTDIGK